MQKNKIQKIKLIFISAFSLLFVLTFCLPESRMAIKAGKDMPAFIVLDDEEKENSKYAGSKGKTPFDHDQHVVAVEKCVTCHHTNSEKLDKNSEIEVQKCSVCHTDEEKKIDGKTAVIAKKAFHGDKSEFGCIGCHEKRDKMPKGKDCSECHTGQDTITEYRYKPKK